MPFNMLKVGCLPVETQSPAQRYTLLEECSLPLGYAGETRWGWVFWSLPWAAWGQAGFPPASLGPSHSSRDPGVVSGSECSCLLMALTLKTVF